MRSILRELLSKEYLLVVAVSWAGYLSASPWFLAPAAFLLTCWSDISSAEYFWRFRAIAKLHVFFGVWLAVLVQNFLFLAICFGMGHGVRWLWTHEVVG